MINYSSAMHQRLSSQILHYFFHGIYSYLKFHFLFACLFIIYLFPLM